MAQKTTFKKKKGSSLPNSMSETSKCNLQNTLTPVRLSGVVAPWNESLSCGHTSDYKLVSSGGTEYFIVADDEWREILSTYCWEEVKIIGLLNISNMTLIPQKVYPKGPAGENVIDMASSKGRNFVKKLFKNVNDLVFVPAAVLAIIAA